LADHLRRLSRAFEDWRYVFEGEGQQLPMNLLIAFVKVVYGVVRARHREWHVRPDEDQRLLGEALQPSMTVANLGAGTFTHIVDGTSGTLIRPGAG
jgi:hypothetical protein